MKRLITILTFLIWTNSYASNHFDILRDTFASCSTLTTFKDKLESNYKDFRLTKENVRLSRSLDFGYAQTVYEIEISYEKSYVKDFRVFLVYSTHDSIVLGTIQELDYYDKVEKSENFRKSDGHIDNYINLHQAQYGTALQKKDFLDQLTELIIYGFGCSEGGQYYPPEAKQMMDYVDSNNYDKLSQWLRQINPELQAYAVDGLLRLDKKGIEIKQPEEKLIEQLKKRNSDIYHCTGCIYGISTTIEEIIKRGTK